MEKQTIQVLWTGGMDSTLIVLQLSQMDVKVLPVYIINANGRKTESIELTAMNKIYEKLKKDPRTKADLLPIRLVADNREQIPEVANQFEFEYYKRVRYRESSIILRKAQKKIADLQANVAKGIGGFSNIIRLAIQYMPVISYARTENAKTQNPTIAIGINGDESFFLLPDIYKVKSVQNNLYILDKDGTDPDLYEVFKNISFPLYPLNKVGIYKMYSEIGYESIRNMLCSY